MQHRPISFPNWKQVLAESTLSASLKAAYEREILGFLRHCKAGRVAATVQVARQFLDWREKQSDGPAREALRWFYRQGSRLRDRALGADGLTAGQHQGLNPIRTSPEPESFATPTIRRAMEPPLAASDVG